MSLSSDFKKFFSDMRPSVATGGYPFLPLGVLFALNAADELDRVAFGVLLPDIQDYYGVSLATVLSIVSIAGAMVLLLAVPVGYLADRWNRTRLLAAGAVCWGVFSILTSAATSIGVLAGFRFGSGMGKTMDPAQQSLLADWYPPHARGGVYAFHRLGNSLGQIAGPLMAGWLATLFFWQAPFLVFGLIGFVCAAFTVFKLKEPARGEHELALSGLAVPDDQPKPTWTEAWRIARSVRTLRRIWLALPFLVGAYAGTASLVGVYLEDQFGLSAASRGTIIAFIEPFGILGIIVGGSVANRFLFGGKPGRLITYAGLLAMAGGVTFVVMTLIPVLPLVLVMMAAFSFSAAVFVPATTALSTLVIPPKARGFALGLSAVFIVPGIALVPIAGALGDRYGPRIGVLALAPIYMIGAMILTSAGPSVDADIRAAVAGAAAAAQIQAAAGRTSNRDVLVVKDLDVHYGSVQILFGVDFTVAEGEIVALLGTNGAGKSTLLNAISGSAPVTNGAINLDGEDITHLPAAEHPLRGIASVPGGKGVFPSLTVADNIRLSNWGTDDEDERAAALDEVLDQFPRLRERWNEDAGSLSGGEQQMLVLAQAFLARPRLLMIDELSLGLAPTVVAQLLGIVKEIHARGTTVILVEQSVNIALTVADRAVFMEKGEVRFTGPTQELMGRPDLLRSVFLGGASTAGGTLASRARRRPSESEEPEQVLRVTGLSKSFGGIRAVSDVGLTLDEGAILGLIGPNGAGKTTIFDLVSGFVDADEGTVELLGEDVTYLGPEQRALRGLQRSFQDAQLFGALTVEETILVALDRHLDTRNPIFAGLHLPNVRAAEKKLRRRADRLVELLGLEAFRGKFLRELSTGSRRLVDVACVLAAEPRVLLLDEPSSGVAQKETEELGPLLLRVRYETSCSILIIEHDMQLVSSISDELLALDTGSVVTRGKPDAVLTHPKVVASYLGENESAIARSDPRPSLTGSQ